MKKRLCVWLLAAIVVLGLAGCGKKEGPPSKAVAGEGVEENVKKVPPKESDAQEEGVGPESVQMPVLGTDDKNYKSFQYLEACEIEDDGIKAVVYVPESENLYQSREMVASEALGVTVSVQLNPFIQLEQEDYTMKENMETYIENAYEFDDFYYSDYKDIEMSEINEITKEAASITTSRLEYNRYSESYTAVWSLYYMVKTDDERIFMVTVTIDSDNTTGYTEDLLAELEAYLGIGLEYNQEEMQAKLDGYDPSEEGNIFSTGDWKFELPEGWEEDVSYKGHYSEEYYNEYAYAPGGDANRADCMIFISNDYVGEDTDYIRDVNEDEMLYVIKEFLPEGASDVKCEILGDTAVGYTLKLYFAEDEIRTEMYFVYNGHYVYTVMALEDGAKTEVFEIAEQIINTAKTRGEME